MDTDKPVRRTRDAARTTSDILRAATAEFAEFGFAGARVDRIAAASGVTKGLLFQRFGDKAGVYGAVLEVIRVDAARVRSGFVGSRLATRPASAGAFLRIVEDLVRVNIEFLGAHPAARRILAWEQASAWSGFRALDVVHDDADATALLALFADAQRAGWLGPDATPEAQLALTFDIPHARLGSLAAQADGEETFLARMIARGLVVLDITEEEQQ